MNCPPVFLIAFVFSTACYARLNESPEGCTARYGEPLEENKDDQTIMFQKSGYFIIVHFHEEKVDDIAFRSLETDALGNGKEMSDNSIELILKANGGDVSWTELKGISRERRWVTADGKIYAAYRPTSGLLMLFTESRLKRKAEAKKAAEEKQLDGF